MQWSERTRAEPHFAAVSARSWRSSEVRSRPPMVLSSSRLLAPTRPIQGFGDRDGHTPLSADQSRCRSGAAAYVATPDPKARSGFGSRVAHVATLDEKELADPFLHARDQPVHTAVEDLLLMQARSVSVAQFTLQLQQLPDRSVMASSLIRTRNLWIRMFPSVKA